MRKARLTVTETLGVAAVSANRSAGSHFRAFQASDHDRGLVDLVTVESVA